MPKKKTVRPEVHTLVADPYAEDRAIRLQLMREGKLPVDRLTTQRRRIGGREISPALEGLGKRAQLNWWRSREEMIVRSEDEKDAPKVIDPGGTAIKNKIKKANDYVGTYWGYRGVLRPEYDMLEPFTLVDTEAYVKQALNRRLSLMMRNGFEVVSNDRQEYADYIKQRLQTIEYVMQRPMVNLFRDILTNLCLVSNCFLRKIRDVKASTGKSSASNHNRVPIAGYVLVPPHVIFPYIEKGVITKWRRYFDSGMPYEDYSIDDIIHLKWDCKPGHIYGTPRTVGVRDDVFALRRLEENIELLLINHLFPLFHVKVGTVEAPTTYFPDGSSEIDAVRQSIETMPKEGVFVTDERVAVDVVGAQKDALQTKDVVAHFKSRVYTGLGVSPLDMGEGDTANRSTADNISQVLKDSVKMDLDLFAGLMRMHVFRELFEEATLSLSIQKGVASTHLQFHEVDMDNKIKEENHAIQLYENNGIHHDEFRKKLKMKPMSKEEAKGTHHERETKDLLTHESKLSQQESEKDVENQKALANTQMKVMQAGAEAEHSKAEAEKKKVSAKVTLLRAKTAHHKATGKGKPNGTVANRNAPANQHGKKTSPKRNRAAREITPDLIYDRLLAMHGIWDKTDPAEWKRLVHAVIDGVVQEIGDNPENSYTRQVHTGADRLKQELVAVTDPEMLYVLVNEFDDEDTDAGTEVEPDAAGDEDLFGEDDPAGEGDLEEGDEHGPKSGPVA